MNERRRWGNSKPQADLKQKKKQKQKKAKALLISALSAAQFFWSLGGYEKSFHFLAVLGLPLMTCCTLHSVWVVSVIFKSVLHGNRHDIQPPDIATDICKCSETISPFSLFFFLPSCKLSVDNYFIMLSTLKCNNANNIVLWQSQYLLRLAAFSILLPGQAPASQLSGVFFSIVQLGIDREIVGGSQCGLLDGRFACRLFSAV